MSITFLTEKEAKNFLKNQIIGDVEMKETIAKWKTENIILDSIVDKAEEEFDKYSNETRNLSKYKKVLKYLEEDNDLIELFYNTIQYQKNENQELKDEINSLSKP